MNDTKSISIMLVDDHDMVRIGLKVSIEKHDSLTVVAEASTGAEAVDLYQKYAPDVVLMDLLMPQMNGIEATKKILEIAPDACIIALTSYAEDPLVQSAIEAGVISYLLKDISAQGIIEAIQDAYAGKSTLAQEATQALMRVAQTRDKRQPDLTAAELRVLKLIADGLTNDEIAQKLFVSKSTVKKHVSRILSKMDVSNRAEAAIKALKLNLVDSNNSSNV
jgi:NarL family two-component system response regulator LiaR